MSDFSPSRFAPLPDPPYHAVIFTAQLSENTTGYGEMADRMVALAQTQPGYLGIESTRDDAGLGITVSYWVDEAALIGWKDVSSHLLAQKMGKTRWYEHYTLRVAKVERAYDGPEGRG
ncbi:antibiotic biosynthesis monooxygenase [Aliiroseovarius subalbicans]|uniref:antibiotic biosynthesis monooxygenase family protein n=1 Tax=Aliiroseovarius subalbicans TaxID=2925840 RepID=UPI001F599C25|nr:antibiotic biosynthesis monooxygenase [Aliiroseovarius subalbicans]MCI2398354.1 antibiotic biosynthesis monooxygenase [Aliiroseovarius subalbicans]